MAGMDLIRSATFVSAAVVVLCVSAIVATAEPAANSKSPNGANTEEMGTIDWVKGFDAAADRARREKKPVLILFQEIPGCATCTGYGREVLSHPLIKDAAESLFVPVCVRNNTQGDDDARIVSHFIEPSWNNPVIRIVTPDRKMIGDRVSGDYTVGGLANAMAAALREEHRVVPKYLELLAHECLARKRGLERAVFAMHCFWEGEAAFGSTDGVISTRPGFLNGKEVVEVEFDPRVVGYSILLSKAMERKCASSAFTRSDAQQEIAKKSLNAEAMRSDESIRPDREPKYYLSKTDYRFVPMTELQASRVNALIHTGGNPDTVLSPSQIALYKHVGTDGKGARSSMIGRPDIVKAWREANAVADGD